LQQGLESGLALVVQKRRTLACPVTLESAYGEDLAVRAPA